MESSPPVQKTKLRHALPIVPVVILSFALGCVATWVSQVQPRQDRIDNAGKALAPIESTVEAAAEANRRMDSYLYAKPDALAESLSRVRKELEGD